MAMGTIGMPSRTADSTQTATSWARSARSSTGAPGGGAPDVFAERDALMLASVVVPVGLVLGALAPANAERDSTVEAYAGHALERGR